MKALVTVPDDVAVVDVPDPGPGRDEVLVAVDSCGICGSDVHAVESNLFPPGLIMGHEFSGTVVDAGPEAGTWQPGQAVAVNPLGSCGSCQACRLDLPFRCTELPNLGLGVPGGYAEFVAVPHHQLRAVPDGMALELGARVEPLAVALRAVHLADVEPGDAALVYGVGAIGLNVILALRAAGAGTIVAVGRSPGRRAAAGTIGADVVLDSRETTVSDYVTANGLEFRHAFECSAAEHAIPESLGALALGGTIVEVALPPQPAPVDTRAMVGVQARLIGSCAFGEADFTEALELIHSGRADAAALVSNRVPLSDAPDAFRQLRNPGSTVAVLVRPTG